VVKEGVGSKEPSLRNFKVA